MGTWELLLVLGIVLLLFGAKRLPGLAAGLGGAVRAFKKGATEDDAPDELKDGKQPKEVGAKGQGQGDAQGDAKGSRDA